MNGNYSKPTLNTTALRNNGDYILYYNNLTRLLLLGIIPFSLLAYFNYKIYKGMSLPSFLSEQENVKEKRRMQESDLAIVLIGIVVVFVLSHVLRIFLNVYEWIHGMDQQYDTTCLELTKVFNDLFLVLNSSCNMIIYCCLNSTFRKSIKNYLKKVLRKLSCRNRDVDNRDSYHNVRTRQRPQSTSND